ncbi:MAG TPA: aminoglycoside phosphotransferase [Rhodospirillaceae bacterium]|nr:MAG: hypothetical protein A2018_07425 [Alphaproteobacteria bacterium GWF2_58_20]HAU29305.1 aminoglycoside phosphotransferase [Rhodospirillaceae bacterium]
MPQEREYLQTEFLAMCGWGNADIVPLSSDASFRRYFRLSQNGMRALLMDAPPGKEKLSAYLAIGQHLISLGFSAPDIYASDTRNGFALIEDFGDDTFTRLLAQGTDPYNLYELAINVLSGLHEHPHAGRISLPAYDMDALLEEALLLPIWHLSGRRGHATQQDLLDSYAVAWKTILAQLPDMPKTLVLRDYHVDNLMRLDERSGRAACGLLDFQDALIGHPAYDLMSLLEDARRDIPQDMATALRTRYETRLAPGEREAFSLWYDVLAAQRHTKVAGIFVRLCIRDGKNRYLAHIPHVMRLLERHLSHPALTPLSVWLNANMPDRLEPLPGMDVAALRAELGLTDPA